MIGLREAGVALLRWHAGRQGIVLHVSPLGKAKTGFQMTAIVALMLVPDPAAAWVTVLLLVVVGLTVVSGLQYVARLRAQPGRGARPVTGGIAVSSRAQAGPGVRRTHLRLLVNPFVSRLDDVTAEAVTRCLGTGFAVSVVHTEAPGHATALAREAAEAGYDLVAAVGGDGTVSEAASGLVGSPTPLACVPAGVTNVFARAIGMPREPVEAARRLVEHERAGRLPVRAVDVGTVNGHHFLYTAGVGFTAAMAETAERRPDRKARRGQFHFAATGLAEIGRRYLRRPPQMEIEAEGLRAPRRHGRGPELRGADLLRPAPDAPLRAGRPRYRRAVADAAGAHPPRRRRERGRAPAGRPRGRRRAPRAGRLRVPASPAPRCAASTAPCSRSTPTASTSGRTPRSPSASSPAALLVVS